MNTLDTWSENLGWITWSGLFENGVPLNPSAHHHFPWRFFGATCPDSFAAQGSAWSLDWKEQGCPSSRGKWQPHRRDQVGSTGSCSPIHGHYKDRFKCRYTHTYHISYIYISYIYHKSNRFQNNNLETPETPRAFPAGSGFESSSIQASKAQVNEVQQQTQTKIDVDFDTDPCKCYIKAGMTQIYPEISV